MTYGLDTSVVVRLLMCEPPELAVKARDFVEAALDTGHLFYISDLAISETYFVLQHHYGKTKESAISSIRAIQEMPGFSFSAEAKAALDTPDAWKASPGLVDRMIISEYTSKGFVTVSCEKDFRKLDFTEVIA